MKPSAAIFNILNIISIANAAKILFVSPIGTHSHYTVGYSLVKGLAVRGHQVTFASAFEEREPVQNLKIVYLKDLKKQTEGRNKYVIIKKKTIFRASL